MTMTEYARSVGIPAFSLELFPPNESEEAQKEAFQTTKTVVMRAMQGRGHVPDAKNLEGLRDITSQLPDIKQVYTVVHSEPFTGFELKLKEGLKNFMPVKAGDVLGMHSDSQTELKAPVDGFLFHPKYLAVPAKQTSPTPQDAQSEEDKEETKVKPINAPKYLYQIIQFKKLEDF
jgi:succinylglutamate desuccinylase